MSAELYEVISSKARDFTSSLHRTANEYRQASGNTSNKDLDAWIDSSVDPEITRRRDRLAAAAEMIKKEGAELREMARKALVPEGANSDELGKKFKADKTEAKQFLLKAIGTLETLGAPDDVIEELQQYLEQLPNVSGSTGAGLSGSGKSPEELAAAREYLRGLGHEVADKGRISKELLEVWDKRHDLSEAVAS